MFYRESQVDEVGAVKLGVFINSQLDIQHTLYDKEGGSSVTTTLRELINSMQSVASVLYRRWNYIPDSLFSWKHSQLSIKTINIISRLNYEGISHSTTQLDHDLLDSRSLIKGLVSKIDKWDRGQGYFDSLFHTTHIQGDGYFYLVIIEIIRKYAYLVSYHHLLYWLDEVDEHTPLHMRSGNPSFIEFLDECFYSWLYSRYRIDQLDLSRWTGVMGTLRFSFKDVLQAVQRERALSSNADEYSEGLTVMLNYLIFMLPHHVLKFIRKAEAVTFPRWIYHFPIMITPRLVLPRNCIKRISCDFHHLTIACKDPQTLKYSVLHTVESRELVGWILFRYVECEECIEGYKRWANSLLAECPYSKSLEFLNRKWDNARSRLAITVVHQLARAIIIIIQEIVLDAVEDAMNRLLIRNTRDICNLFIEECCNYLDTFSWKYGLVEIAVQEMRSFSRVLLHSVDGINTYAVIPILQLKLSSLNLFGVNGSLNSERVHNDYLDLVEMAMSSFPCMPNVFSVILPYEETVRRSGIWEARMPIPGIKNGRKDWIIGKITNYMDGPFELNSNWKSKQEILDK
jgi:hypothetical protein